MLHKGDIAVIDLLYIPDILWLLHFLTLCFLPVVPRKAGMVVWTAGGISRPIQGEERKEEQDLPETSQSKNGAAGMILALPRHSFSVPSLLLRTHWHLE